MDRHPVTSSSIKSVGYNRHDQVLEIEFTSGAVYQYRKVSPEVYLEFMRASSLGVHFATFIRPCFEFERVHVFGCVHSHEPDGCREDCPCWCHKQRKDVSNAQSQAPQN